MDISYTDVFVGLDCDEKEKNFVGTWRGKNDMKTLSSVPYTFSSI